MNLIWQMTLINLILSSNKKTGYVLSLLWWISVSILNDSTIFKFQGRLSLAINHCLPKQGQETRWEVGLCIRCSKRTLGNLWKKFLFSLWLWSKRLFFFLWVFLVPHSLKFVERRSVFLLIMRIYLGMWIWRCQ